MNGKTKQLRWGWIIISLFLLSMVHTNVAFGQRGRTNQRTSQTSESVEAIYEKGVAAYEKENYTEAVKYFHTAAELGNAKAQNDLGVCYKHSQGVTQDLIKAVIWFRKAAEQGNVMAQYNLGLCYDNGEGVMRNKTEALEWYRKAAEQGHSEAQYRVGLRYYYGNGVTKNRTEAFKWLRKAAEQGNAKAKIVLEFPEK